MKIKSLVGVLLASCVVSGLGVANEVMTENQFISLGTINGSVVNEVVEVKRILPNSTLLSVDQNQLGAPLNTLLLKQALLNQVQQGELSATVEYHLPNGESALATVSIELWLDGKKVLINANQIGSMVSINIAQSFNRLELRSSRELEIKLPKGYKGDVKFDLDIEGYASVE